MNNKFNRQHPVSGCCDGEKCRICGNQASHKVAEEIFPDDSTGFAQIQGHRIMARHPFTAYLCCTHFQQVFGLSSDCNF